MVAAGGEALGKGSWAESRNKLTSGVCSSSLSGNSIGFGPTCIIMLAGVAEVDTKDGVLPAAEVKLPTWPAIGLFRDILAALY
ncbi:hypothetical protein E2562_035152 [Oryza meyeriana var. granulata]|uniref:Uncharacterized protein n=1 Tax=Oryza meyeriana var. granulata TaxID=110450 RepID=A0A6G1E6M5_9ORYZ|nr:hypothetical protein E2562_035152 [Oryza meyeriana var. granulata]